MPSTFDALRAAHDGGRLHHAYLLVGPPEADGLGTARRFAALLICSSEAERPCGACAPCRKLEGGNHPDVLALEPNDKDVITIDAVRGLSARLALRAQEAAIKVIIVRNAERMNVNSQNALLKTLEEPPGRTCFLLVARQSRGLLPTIRSRCVRLSAGGQSNAAPWRALADAGIEENVARALSTVVGADVNLAQETLAEGFADWLERLYGVLEDPDDLSRLMAAAAELGRSKEATTAVLAVLEAWARDRLATSHGAPTAQWLLGADTPAPSVDPSAVNALCAHLTRTRRLRAVHLNRTMVLEQALMLIRG